MRFEAGRKILAIIIVLTFIFPMSVSAEATWQKMGETGIKQICGIDDLDVYNGTPTFAFIDDTNGSKGSVYKFSNNSWTSVGGRGISSDSVRNMKLDIYDGKYYCAFIDMGSERKITVMKHSGNVEGNWETIGNKGFSESGISYLDFVVYNGIPYVAFAKGPTMTVMKFNGVAWERIGDNLQNTNDISTIRLAVDAGIPYLAFKYNVSQHDVSEMQVVQFVGNEWQSILNSNNSSKLFTEAVSSMDFCVYAGIPYIIYEFYFDEAIGPFHRASNNQKHGIKVCKYDGSRWVSMDGAGTTSYSGMTLRINVDSRVPYISYSDGSGIRIMKHNGQSWESVGAGFRGGGSYAFAVSGGTPYLGYNPSEGMSVIKYGDASTGATQSNTTPSINDQHINSGDLGTTIPAAKPPIIGGQAETSIILKAQGAAGYVKLDWNRINDPKEVAGYYIYKSASAGGQTSTPETDFYITDTTYNDTKAAPGTPYYYIVKPVFSDKSMGNASNEVSAKSLPGGGSIELTINSPMMKVNGVSQEIDPGSGTTPIIKDGRTFLPIRALVEAMGGSISWNNSQKKLTILYNGKTVELWIGSNKVCVNGIDKEMDVVPYVSDKGRTMLPLRFVAENLGCVISWDNSTLTARIVYEKVNEGTAAAPSTTETAIPPEAATPPANANTTNSQTGTMSWTGVWDSLYGTMILTQSGNKVTGTYESDDYILEGTVNGNTLSGTYNEDGDIGHFEFVLIGDGTFSGRHRYEGDQEWSEWSGRSISASHGSTGTAWGGVWYTDYGPMIVTQSGFSFSGVYKGAGLYRIEGTISGTTVKGKIFEGESHGEFQFTLLGDGKGFVGKWRYDGEAEWTDWTGIKKK